MPGSAGHLIRRFFAVSSAQKLDDDELQLVAGWLSPPELELFLAQPVADQRHGLEAGVYVRDHQGDHEAIAAGALHDVGKRHAGLGPVGRSLATIMIILRVASLWDRAATYRDHGSVAARELESAGSAPLVVAFAMHHHGKRPDGVDATTWSVLMAGDEPVKASRSRRPPIT